MLNTKLKITSVAITAALLSGCFASSGGTVAPIAAVTTPPVTTQCAANTTCIPDMSAFSIQTSVDASGKWTTTGTVTTLGATTSTVARDPTTGAPTSVTITGGVSTTVVAQTNSDGYASYDPYRIGGTATDGQHVNIWTDMSQGVQPTSASPTTGLQYSAFGTWDKYPSNVSTRTLTFGGYAGGGNFTMTMPTTGSATYTGRVAGYVAVDNNNTLHDLRGNLNLTANFAASAITGSMTGMTASDSLGAAAGLFNNVALAGTISGNAFTGTATAGALPAGTNAAAIAAGTVGTASGHFYGPAANEVAGLWGMSGGGVTVVGAFGAKQ